MAPWTEKYHADARLLLEDFALDYLRDKQHYSDVKSEDLAEAFRAFCKLPPFPTLTDLRLVCERLSIAVEELKARVPGLSAVNTWSGARHSIFLRTDIAVAHAETSLCHELREVIEQTFSRVRPDYDRDRDPR